MDAGERIGKYLFQSIINYGMPVAYCTTVHNNAQPIPAKIPQCDLAKGKGNVNTCA
jgi:hypothetical protein